MSIKKIVLGFLVLSLLACNFVTQLVAHATATPIPTGTAVPSLTLAPSSLIPAYIPPECNAVPPATISPDSVFAQPTATIEPNPDISQDTQLRILQKLGDIIEEGYVYPDFNGRDWNEIKSRYRGKIEAGLTTESFYVEMQAMITELGDEHSFFLSPLEAKRSEAELRGENDYVGVGIYSLPDEKREVFTVISTFPDSPAQFAGIKSHDRILAVDEVPLDFTQDTTIRVRGPECSAVMLTVQSPNEAPRDLLLIRSAIHGALSIEKQLVPTTDGSKIGYIFIPTFFDETIPPQIDQALNEFGPLDGLILDVRLNGGGSSSVVDPILTRFVSGRLGQFVSRTDSRSLDVTADPINNSLDVPLIIIVSEDTVSYGEIFSGVLKDSGRANIVGETSLGNVEVLHGFNFDDGSEAWIASETFHSAFSDANWEITGIVPDVTAFAEWDTITFETDPSIAAALEFLGHQ